MAEEAVIVVKSINSKQMTSASGKEFTTVGLESETGLVFSGYDNQLPKELKQGDSLSIKFQQINTKAGTVVNKIITSELSNGTTTTTTQTTQPAAPAKKPFLKVSNGSITNGKTFDNKGARTGGVLHDAVALAIHNASMQRSSVVLNTVEGLAQELLQIAARLEK
jgi:hypothetical protein